ncbi:MAG: glycerol-3-phosphate dehydrogenase/oxidase [Bacteroidales bacterium]|nr:glycerol-3-phosphate dehydrogenase/oxidase [Bacteroidales bacterium]
MILNKFLANLESQEIWDICIIGGGATGLGAALDAASRGLKTVLFEQHDFAKGTSSRSTKLVHGGVRYLQQGNIKLVFEALRERGLLLKNAPHLVHNQKFIVPNYKWWEKSFYGIGLKIYDKMAGELGLGSSELLSTKSTLKLIPTLDPKDLRGGVLYHDGQFDDARLAINIAQTAAKKGATVLNYFQVIKLNKIKGKISGVEVCDQNTGRIYQIKSRCVINATGVFTDSIMKMDDKKHKNIITPSQGIHLVVDGEFLNGETAIMVPRTDDGRVLFAVPWHNKVVLGTTDTPIETISTEPIALKEEIAFILKHIGRYLTKQPQPSDIKSIFAGLRPLVKGNSDTTAALSRDHLITISKSAMITVTGGKWTTYRKMAEDTIDIALSNTQIIAKTCVTKTLKLVGSDKPQFSADIEFISESELEKLIQKSIKEEMCQTVEDFLARRTRQLFLDAKIAILKAPFVATIMANELNKDKEWVNSQISDFNNIAKNYLPNLD